MCALAHFPALRYLTTMSKLPRLISFPSCPYVQRAVIALREKAVAHETTYIDLAHKPDWFLALSPRGRVPLLVVDGPAGDIVLFESQAICEYLDEIHGENRLMPTDLVERARDRAFAAFAAEDLLLPVYQSMRARSRTELERPVDTLRERLARLQQELGDRSWLSGNGSRFGMADVLVAPAWSRIDLLEDVGGWSWPAALEPVRAYGARVQARPSVAESMPATWRELSLARSRDAGGFLALSTVEHSRA
jgi:glutathione S-transferase